MKVFVINLERSGDRRARLEENFSRFDFLDYEFFQAVDGKALPSELLGLVDRRLARKRLGREMSNGEIGCALSHALLYQRIVREDIEDAIILEDDAILGPDFFTMIASGSLPAAGFDQVLLHCRHPRVLRFPVAHTSCGKGLYRLVHEVWGATAYYLTRAGAHRLWRASVPIGYVADWPVPLECWRRVAVLYPFVVYPPLDEVGESTLEAERAEFLQGVSKEPHSLLKRAVVRCGALLIFPCLVWPRTFGTLEEVKHYLYRYLLRFLSKNFGRSLPWTKPANWPPEPGRPLAGT